MHDVIQQVIASEAEAREIVATARAEAERIVLHAKREAEELTARIRSETRADADLLLAAATRDAEREKQERLAHESSKIEIQVRLDPALRQRAVTEVIRCVCGQPGKAKGSP
jgi:vacuolar-type H+-ATPase subunit H